MRKFFVLMAALLCAGALGAAPADMVFIQGGTFTMGSPPQEAGRDHDEKQRAVTVGSFYLGRTEVTQKDYQALMGANPSAFKDGGLPVTDIDWYGAVVLQRPKQVRGSRPGIYGERDECHVEQERERLPSAHGSGVGVRLSGGDYDAVQHGEQHHHGSGEL